MISALIHKPAEAVVIHACRIRHVYFALVLMTFLVPWQLGAMTDSEEEMILINDVALLDSRLKKAGCPCDETMFSHLFRDFAGKSFAKRMQLWKFRKDMRQTLLDDSPRDSNSLRTNEANYQTQFSFVALTEYTQ